VQPDPTLVFKFGFLTKIQLLLGLYVAQPITVDEGNPPSDV
jgi:hypothetical protein